MNGSCGLFLNCAGMVAAQALRAVGSSTIEHTLKIYSPD